jgi:hypothetical protein
LIGKTKWRENVFEKEVRLTQTSSAGTNGLRVSRN